MNGTGKFIRGGKRSNPGSTKVLKFKDSETKDAGSGAEKRRFTTLKMKCRRDRKC